MSTDYRRGTQSASEATIFASQHGVIAREQALALGLTAPQIHRRLEAGRWIAVHRGVYRSADVPFGWHGRVLAACLAFGPGALASHRAAGALWGLDGCERPPVEVTWPGTGSKRLAGAILHRTRVLPRADRAEREGVPATRPARTLVDLAAVLEHERLEAALDSALRDGLLTVAYLEGRLAALGTHGRHGAEALRAMLGERRDGRPAESRWECRLARDLVAAGLPQPVRQFELCDGGRVAARFDLAYPGRRIGIEYESYRHHHGRQAWRRDQARHNRATALGWLVFHLTKGEGLAAVVAAYRAAA